MKLSIVAVQTILALGSLSGCQGEEQSDAEAAESVANYVYRGQTFTETSSSPNPELDRLFDDGRILVRLTHSAEPLTTYLFDTHEESEEQQKKWQAARYASASTSDPVAPRSGAREVTGSTAEALSYGYTAPTFLVCNGLMLADGCRDVLSVDLYNEDSGRYEWPDLRDWLYSAPLYGSMNDTISSLGGHSHDPATQIQHSFKVVVWEHPGFRGESWTIVVDAARPDFFDGNIHDNRMGRRNRWGDNITSIYAELLP